MVPRGEDFRKLQLTELAIAGEVAKLCESYRIPYVLHGGSALGARRHRGFIPWDDDVDIAMLRDDYDRFIEAAKAGAMPAQLYLQEWRDDPHMAAPYAKVRLNGTALVEEWSQHTGGHKGIFVDIFPLDDIPDGRVARLWHMVQLKFWIRLLHHRIGYTMNRMNGPLRLADMVVRGISRLVPQRIAKRKLHNVLTHYRGRATECVAAVGGSHPLAKETIRRSWVTDPVPCEFEGQLFLCAPSMDAYLTHVFGDFMSPPPVEEQHGTHGLTHIDFGPYEHSPPDFMAPRGTSAQA